MVEKIKQVLSQIQEQIAPYTPNIVAVTKYFGREAILDAYQVGLRNFGENNANEEQKFGFSKEELFENFSKIKDLKGLNILGLMNIAPLGLSENELDILFEDVRQTQNELVNKFNCEMKELSMGMSQDYQIAVRHGATMLRIGRKLFSN